MWRREAWSQGCTGRDHREQLKAEAMIRRLPEVFREWRGLKQRLPEKSEEESMTREEPGV